MLSYIRRGPYLLWGVICVCIATAMYLFGVLLVIPRYLLGMNAILLPLNEWIVRHIEWSRKQDELRRIYESK